MRISETALRISLRKLTSDQIPVLLVISCASSCRMEAAGSVEDEAVAFRGSSAPWALPPCSCPVNPLPFCLF